MIAKLYRGLTFIEILIAIVIINMILAVILAGLSFASKYARHNANKTMALYLAGGLLEEIQDTAYAEIGSYDGYMDTKDIYQSASASIELSRKSEVTDTDQYKTIVVTASWDWQDKSYTESISTIISDHN